MATLPQFKQRQIARRSTSDIERLAKQYKANVEALTGEYQTAFTGYQAGVAEKMKPFEEQRTLFEEQAKTYKESLLPTYETQKAKYLSNLDAYNATLAEITKNPFTQHKRMMPVPQFNLVRKEYPGGLSVMEPEITYNMQEETYYKPRAVPKFTEKAPVVPTAPIAPVAPEVEEFDEVEFDTKRAAAESEFKREVGERRAARVGAVSRKMTRPMLKGAE